MRINRKLNAQIKKQTQKFAKPRVAYTHRTVISFFISFFKWLLCTNNVEPSKLICSSRSGSTCPHLHHSSHPSHLAEQSPMT